MKLAMVGALCIAALAALFAVQNAQHTQVSFLVWYFEAPLVMVLLLTFAAGACAGFLAALPASLKKSLEIRRLKSQPPPSPATAKDTTAVPAPPQEKQPSALP